MEQEQKQKQEQEQKQKQKGDRVTEAIDILTKLKGVGIPDTEYGYKQTKAYLDLWIANGEPQIQTIEFVRYGRIGHMTLPSEKNSKAIYVLKATDELKRQMAAETSDCSD